MDNFDTLNGDAFAVAADDAQSSARGRLCKSCGSSKTEQAPGTGPHHARLLCADCGAFIQWLAKPRGTIDDATDRRAARELVGEISDMRFRGADTRYTVADLATGETVVGSDPHSDLRTFTPYRFLGRWVTHPTHGEQFSFDTFVRHEPHDRTGVIAYLEKTARHVGHGVAVRLWNAYGSDAVAMLRTRPDDVAAAGIMTVERARDAASALQTYAGVEAVRIDLWTLFAGQGFPRTLIDAALTRWGLRAPARIRHDPFCLMIAGLPGCGFVRCDKLYLALGRPAHRLKRQMLCCWRALDELASQGHTWAQVERVSRELVKAIGADHARPRDAICGAIRARWIAKRRDSSGQLWLAVGDNARQEETITKRLTALLNWRPPTPEERAAERERIAAVYQDMEWDDP